ATIHDLASLPEDEGELASLLFSADPVSSEVKKPRGWRERYSELEAPPPPPADPGRVSRPGRTRVRRGDEEISVDLEVDLDRRSSGEVPPIPVRRSGAGLPAAVLPAGVAPAAAPPPAPVPAPVGPADPDPDPDAATTRAPLRAVPSVRPPP